MRAPSKKLKKILLSKPFIIGILLLIQFIFIFTIIYIATSFNLVYGFYIEMVFKTLSIIVALYIFSKEMPISYKLSWIFPILVFSIFGGLFYIIYNTNNYSKKAKRKALDLKTSREQILKSFTTNSLELAEEKFCYKDLWPSYIDSDINFFGSGEESINSILEDIKNAKKYIFIEFFIISKGQIWNKFLEIFKQKLNEGVEIYILYDDFGSSTLPNRYYKKLRKMGLYANSFNKIIPLINFRMNFRNHRKIVVIDGKIAYVGGFNLADEYSNLVERYGYWQDTGVRISGNAVLSIAITFMQDWEFESGIKLNYNNFIVNQKLDTTKHSIIPISDSPLEKNFITKNMYLQMINKSHKSINIATPYLVLDQDFVNALSNAVSRGVVVNIVIPQTPDKKIIYDVSLSYAETLIKNGCNVWKFLPGFIHSKLIMIDNNSAMVGSSNFDYRSLYINFENNVWFNDPHEIEKVSNFFDDIINVSKKISLFNLDKSFIRKTYQNIFKGFSPLL